MDKQEENNVGKPADYFNPLGCYKCGTTIECTPLGGSLHDYECPKCNPELFEKITKPQEEQKFTAIYEERWCSGSRWECMTKMLRVSKRADETVEDMLIREIISEKTVYLFEGWPKLQGE